MSFQLKKGGTRGMSALQASASANGRLSKEKQLERKKRERPTVGAITIIMEITQRETE